MLWLQLAIAAIGCGTDSAVRRMLLAFVDMRLAFGHRQGILGQHAVLLIHALLVAELVLLLEQLEQQPC